ncbi:MAG TPA: TlpA disulfide reductase family protein [Anaerolineales bacterium]|nr:TlpA disulfide reductase family protein [Anaerolineales bacterium]
MRNWKLILGLLVLTAFVLTACGGTQPADNIMLGNTDDGQGNNAAMNDAVTGDHDTMNDNMADNMSDDNMSAENMSDDDMADGNMSSDSDDDMADGGDNEVMSEDMGADELVDDPAPNTPDWFNYEFVDARTGQTFTINDFHGQVVMIETMAMWCSNCLRQQGIVKAFHDELGERDDFVAIGLDIDPNEELSRLGSYVQDNGFDWLYGVPSADVTAEISRTFGPQYLNPPSTPIAIIDRDGNIHTLPFGIKSVDDLLGYVDPFLNN